MRPQSFFNIAFLTAIGIASACSSTNSDSNGTTGGAGTAGHASSAGAGGQSGHAGSAATQGGAAGSAGAYSTMNAGQGGTAEPNAGSGGRPIVGSGGQPNAASAGTDSAESGGANGGGGAAGGNAGTANGGGSTGSNGGEAGAANGGEGGAASDSRREFAYIGTVLGGLLERRIEAGSGKPIPLTGSPVGPHTTYYALSVSPDQRFLYAVDEGADVLVTYAVGEDGSLPAEPSSSIATGNAPATLALDPAGHFAYVGSAAGIESFKLDASSGAASSAGAAKDPAGPAYLAIEPSGRFLYATQLASGGVRGYSINAQSGELTELTGSPFGITLVFRGAIVCHPAGTFVYTSGGGVNGFSIEANGALKPLTGSPFFANIDDDASASNLALAAHGHFLYGAVFAGTFAGHLLGFSVQTDGRLQALDNFPITLPAPYSVAVDPTSRLLYVGSDGGELFGFSVAGTGALDPLQNSPFPLNGLQPEIAFAALP